MAEVRKPNPLNTVNRDSLLDRIVAYGKEGKTEASIAASYGVSQQQLRQFARLKQDVTEALELRLTHAQAFWEEKLAAAVQNKSFNAGYCWLMANMFRNDWHSINKLELTGKDGGPIQHETMTPEQREARMKELDQKIKSVMQEKLGIGAPTIEASKAIN